MELKDWIRDARKARGWTQEKLGDELGVTKANISGWENARHQPSFDQIVRICELTGAAMPGGSATVATEPAAKYSATATEEPRNDVFSDLAPQQISRRQRAILDLIAELHVDEQGEVFADLEARASRRLGQKLLADKVDLAALGRGAPDRRQASISHLPERRSVDQQIESPLTHRPADIAREWERK